MGMFTTVPKIGGKGIHNWIGLILLVFMVVQSVTGIMMLPGEHGGPEGGPPGASFNNDATRIADPTDAAAVPAMPDRGERSAFSIQGIHSSLFMVISLVVLSLIHSYYSIGLQHFGFKYRPRKKKTGRYR